MLPARVVCLVCLTVAIASSACTSESPAGPGAVSSGSSPASPSAPVTMRISGLPATLPRGANATLTAELVAGAFTTDCGSRAVWQTDQESVASIDGNGQLTGLSSGVVTVTAECDGLVATGQTTVQWVAPRVWIRSCDPAPSGGACRKTLSQEVTSAAATVEFLDGPRAGQAMKEDDVAQLPPHTLTFPARVRLTARFYEPVSVVLTESAAFSITPGDVQFVVPINFVGSGSTDSYVNDALHAVYDFNTKAAGQVEVGTYWSYFDPAHYVRMVTELWCGEQRLATGGDGLYGFGHSGPEFSAFVPAASACQVRVPESAGLYRLTITYPH